MPAVRASSDGVPVASTASRQDTSRLPSGPRSVSIPVRGIRASVPVSTVAPAARARSAR